MARSNKDKNWHMDFMESFEDFNLKIGIHSCPAEYMRSFEYKRSKLLF